MSTTPTPTAEPTAPAAVELPGYLRAVPQPAGGYLYYWGNTLLPPQTRGVFLLAPTEGFFSDRAEEGAPRTAVRYFVGAYDIAVASLDGQWSTSIHVAPAMHWPWPSHVIADVMPDLTAGREMWGAQAPPEEEEAPAVKPTETPEYRHLASQHHVLRQRWDALVARLEEGIDPTRVVGHRLGDVGRLRQELDAARKYAAELTQQRASAREELAQAAKALGEKRGRNQVLEERLSNVRAEVADALTRLAEEQANAQELGRRLQDATRARDQAVAKLRELAQVLTKE